jgi:hypothetical protein
MKIGLRLFGCIILVLSGFFVYGQDDLLKMLEEETKSDKPDFTTATFKTTRLINGHSVENVAAGVLDFRISHRFGYVNTGVKDFFGLDNATTRLGLDYGISNRLMIGIGRSSYQKQLDGYLKFKILRQSTGTKNMPVTMSIMESMNYKTEEFEDPSRENYYTSRMYFTHQLLIGRKFSEAISLQVMPTVVHYNLVPGTGEIPNDLISIGIGGRVKLSKRVSLNVEYYYQLPDYKLPETTNSLAIGFDIETGGHVFQLHFTNSTGMTERTFITQTTGDFWKGDIHFGFNISRVFTIKDPRKK